jgi:hypothetical protein
MERTLIPPWSGRPPSDRAVRTVDPHADPRWSAFVSSHPDGLVYHGVPWLSALEREYGRQTLCLACEDAGGRLIGILPLVYARGLPIRIEGQGRGRRLASLPRTPVAGPLALDRAAGAALVAAAVDVTRGEPGLRLQLKVVGPKLEGLVEGLVGAAWRPTYVLKLPEDPERLRFGRSRNHRRISWALGKSERSGVIVRAAENEADLRAWYRLYLETMRTHAVPPRPYRFFVALWELLRPASQMQLLVAEQRTATTKRLVAGSIFLMLGQRVFYAFTGASRSDLALRPHDAILWHAIHDACQNGFRRLDLGEATEDDRGLIDFKRKWGAEPQTLHRYFYPRLDGARGVMATGSRLRDVGGTIWRRLPLNATAVLGDWLYSRS